jgi:putative ATPase
MKNLGYGACCRYAHDDAQARDEMPCLPETLRGSIYFEGSNHSEKEPR